MLRSALLVIGHVLTADVIGLVEKMVGGIQTHRLLQQALPSLFPFALFSLTLMTLLKQSRKLSVFQRRQPPPHPLPSLQQSRRYFRTEKVT